jgi:hypothetical protein
MHIAVMLNSGLGLVSIFGSDRNQRDWFPWLHHLQPLIMETKACSLLESKSDVKTLLTTYEGCVEGKLKNQLK